VPVVWTRLDQTATAGSNQIRLQQEVTWKAGDKIVIASTGHRHTQRENEVHIIASVAGDKKTITLVDTLDYEHLGVTEVISGYTLEYRAEVGLLTRNIVLRGERDRQWTEVIEACPDGFDTGKLFFCIFFIGIHIFTLFSQISLLNSHNDYFIMVNFAVESHITYTGIWISIRKCYFCYSL